MMFLENADLLIKTNDLYLEDFNETFKTNLSTKA